MEIIFKNKNKLITLAYTTDSQRLYISTEKMGGSDLYKLLWKDPLNSKNKLLEKLIDILFEKEFLSNRWGGLHGGFPDVKRGKELQTIDFLLEKAKESNIEVMIHDKSKAVLELASFLSTLRSGTTTILYDKFNSKLSVPVRVENRKNMSNISYKLFIIGINQYTEEPLRMAAETIESCFKSGYWDYIPISEEIVELYSEIKHKKE